MARDGRESDGIRKVSVVPYIELTDVLTSDVQSGDVVTYTAAAAGLDASVQTRRVSINIAARYEHQIAWHSRAGDADLVTGLANARFDVLPGVSLEGGALATRSRPDSRGFAPAFFANDLANVSSVYSAYFGPSLSTGRGPIFVNAAYHFGYTKVTSPGSTGAAPGTLLQDYFDDSKSQAATVSTGFKSGTIAPFGVTLSAGWNREDMGQLDRRFDGLYVRGESLLPLTGTFALVGGVGYEKIKATSRDPRIDGAGNVVLDGRGRFVTDTISPRRIAYQTDGIYWDAGVVWRPSPRTAVQGRAGRRYASWSFTGSLSYAPMRDVSVQIGVFDGIETFGNQLQSAVRTLPQQFSQTRDLLAQQFSGCTFGTTGGAAAGACLNSVFQSISTSTYRARGVDAVVAASRGGTTLGFGAGYSNRRFYSPDSPGIVTGEARDESYYAQLFYTTPVGTNTTFSADLFASYYDSGTVPPMFSLGATGSVSRSFGRLSTTASVGAYTFSHAGVNDQTTGQALLGARYHF